MKPRRSLQDGLTRVLSGISIDSQAVPSSQANSNYNINHHAKIQSNHKMSGAGYDVVVDVDEEVCSSIRIICIPFRSSKNALSRTNPTPGRLRTYRPSRRPRIPLLKLHDRSLIEFSQEPRRLIWSASPCDSRQWILETLPLDPILLCAVLRCRHKLGIITMLGSVVPKGELP